MEIGEKRVRIADRQFKNQVFCKKNSNIKLFVKKFGPLYYKYLHLKWKNVEEGYEFSAANVVPEVNIWREKQ